MNELILQNIKIEINQLINLISCKGNRNNDNGTSANLIEQLRTKKFTAQGSQSEIETTSLLSLICWNYSSLRSMFYGRQEDYNNFLSCYLNLLALRNELK